MDLKGFARKTEFGFQGVIELTTSSMAVDISSYLYIYIVENIYFYTYIDMYLEKTHDMFWILIYNI
jgi:hypothetical protein